MKLRDRKSYETLTKDELKVLLEANNIKVKPSYHHEDYMCASFTMPYTYKEKLDRVSKKYSITRSAIFRMLLDMIEE